MFDYANLKDASHERYIAFFLLVYLRIMGRLGGQVNVLIPLGLFGILCMDADQVNIIQHY